MVSSPSQSSMPCAHSHDRAGPWVPAVLQAVPPQKVLVPSVILPGLPGSELTQN